MLREYATVITCLSIVIFFLLGISDHKSNVNSGELLTHSSKKLIVKVVTTREGSRNSIIEQNETIDNTFSNEPVDIDFDKVRWGTISCVGDSITEGARTKSIADTYPGRLQALLNNIGGKAFRVSNKGRQGLCASSSCDNPYVKTAFWKSLTGKQNAAIVVFMMGHNDAKDYNWAMTGASVFKKDYIEMIKTVQTFQSRPKVFICIPPPMYATVGFGINRTIVNTIIPGIVREIASEAGIELIDIYNGVFGGLPLKRSSQESFMSLDGVHPNPTGYHEIGRFIGEAILGKRLASPSPTSSPVSHLINQYSSHMRIIALGDDSTGGSGIRHFTKQFPYRLFLALDHAQHNTFSVDFVGDKTVSVSKKKGTPIWNNERIWTEMKEIRPNMVLIILGRDDCQSETWEGEDVFSSYYNDLVEKIHTESNPEFPPIIISVIPTPVLRSGWGRNTSLANEVLPRLIRKISSSNSKISGTFDFFTLFGGSNRHSHPYIQKDGVHPTRAGAKAMAQYSRDQIMLITKLWETTSPATENYTVPMESSPSPA